MQDVQSGVYSIFNQSSDGIVLLAKDGQVIFINDKAKFLFNAGDKPLAQEYCDQLLQEHPVPFLMQTVDAKGNLSGVNASVVSIPWDGAEVVACTVTPIERPVSDGLPPAGIPMLTEQIFNADSSIVNQSLVGFIVLKGLKFRFVNDYVAKVTGFSREELMSMNEEQVRDLIHADDRERILNHLQEIWSGAPVQRKNIYRSYKRDGSIIWIQAYTSTILFEGETCLLILELDITDRMQALEDLRKNEERYKIISEVISDYAYSQVIKDDGGLETEWVSETILRLIDHDPDETPLFSWSNHVIEQDRKIVETHIQHTLAGNSDIAEFRIVNRKGETVWLREYCKPIFDAENTKMLSIYAVGQDITERKQMRHALHEYERRFRVMLESLSMISIILDTRGKLVFCNEYLLNITGYQRDELLSIDWFETFVPPEMRDMMIRIYQNSMVEGEFPVNYEGEIVTRDNRRRLISWTNTILRDTKGHVIGTASIGEDVTDRRAAEKKLRDSEEKYRQLFSIEPDALIIHDFVTKKIVEANEAMLSLYGYTREELIGLAMTELSAEPEKTLNTILEMPKVKIMKIPLRYHKKKDGTVFPVEVSAGVFVHQGREMIYASVRDISERVKSDRELIEAKERAELSDRLKDAFIANMSHEIRTPLNIILGYTGIIESEISPMLDDEQQEYFKSVERAGQRLQRTVEQLLNLSSMQVGTYATRFEDFDICEQVNNLASDMISMAHAKELTLEVQIDNFPLSVTADRYLVDQALANILDNAIKFTDTGGVAVKVYTTKQYATVEIKDTGIGIAEDYLPKIFSMFSQEVLGYTRPFDGLGLGLALTKMYVDEIAGRVQVSSIKGEGTTVVIDIPLAAADLADSGDDDALDMSTGFNDGIERKSILLIEDDALTQRYMSIALQEYNLHHASSTEEALNVLANHKVDLIFLDRYLKGTFDGLHCAKTIKSNSATADIPIIVLASHEKEEDRQRCEEAGCAEFLIKPLQKNDLENVMTKLFS